MKMNRLVWIAVCLALTTGCGAAVKKEPLSPGARYGVTIRYGETGVKGTLSLYANGDYTFQCKDPSSPLFGLKESVRDGAYRSEFEGIAPAREKMPVTARLLRETLQKLEAEPEIRETELALIDGKECLKRRVTLENGSADLWLNEDEGKPVLLEIEGGAVKMTLRFSENNTGEIPYTETADLSE